MEQNFSLIVSVPFADATTEVRNWRKLEKVLSVDDVALGLLLLVTVFTESSSPSTSIASFSSRLSSGLRRDFLVFTGVPDRRLVLVGMMRTYI